MHVLDIFHSSEPMPPTYNLAKGAVLPRQGVTLQVKSHGKTINTLKKRGKKTSVKKPSPKHLGSVLGTSLLATFRLRLEDDGPLLGVSLEGVMALTLCERRSTVQTRRCRMRGISKH